MFWKLFSWLRSQLDWHAHTIAWKVQTFVFHDCHTRVSWIHMQWESQSFQKFCEVGGKCPKIAKLRTVIVLNTSAEHRCSELLRSCPCMRKVAHVCEWHGKKKSEGRNCDKYSTLYTVECFLEFITTWHCSSYTRIKFCVQKSMMGVSCCKSLYHFLASTMLSSTQKVFWSDKNLQGKGMT